MTEAAGTASQPRDITTQMRMGVTRELIHIGIISRGLNTMGVPKTRGSLMLKMEGAMQMLPRVLSRVDLERIIMTFRGRVQPVPPRVTRLSR